MKYWSRELWCRVALCWMFKILFLPMGQWQVVSKCLLVFQWFGAFWYKRRVNLGDKWTGGNQSAFKKLGNCFLGLWINGSLHQPCLSVQLPAAGKAVPGAGLKSPVLVRCQAMPFQLHRVQKFSLFVFQTWVWTVGRCISHPGWSAGHPVSPSWGRVRIFQCMLFFTSPKD